MPGIVKIGMTTGDPSDRARQLFQTGVPRPFTVEDYLLTPDCTELERLMHEELADNRVDKSREFFEIPVHEAKTFLEDYQRHQVEVWLEEFIPDSVVVHVDEHVDLGGFSSSFHQAVSDAKLHPPEIASVLHELTGEDIAGAIERHRAASAKRREALKEAEK